MCTDDDCRGGLPRRGFLRKAGSLAGLLALAAARASAAEAGRPVEAGTIRIPTRLGAVAGRLSMPADGKVRGGIVLLHGEFGLPKAHRITADDLARQGYATLALSRFSRTPDLKPETVYRADVKTHPLYTAAHAREEIEESAGAVEFLRQSAGVGDRVAAVGFCGGGVRATRLGIRTPLKAVVSFYGPPAFEDRFKSAVDPSPDLLQLVDTINTPMQLHYGTADYVVKAADVDALRSALTKRGVPMETFAYQGATHAFYDQTNEKAFDRLASALARERMLAFLARTLG